MKKALLGLVLMLCCASAVWATELLCKAQEPWNNEADTSNMTIEEKESFDSRSRKGDVIVVRPDGWEWGREECLPRFIVVKITNLSYEDAKHFEESLMVSDGVDEHGNPKTKMAKVRKWQVPNKYMTDAISAGKSVITITLSAKQTQFIANLIEKTK